MNATIPTIFQRIGKIGVILLYGLGYFLAIAGISTALSYFSHQILSHAQPFIYVMALLFIPVLTVIVVVATFPILLNEKNRRAQDVAFIVAGLIALQTIFQANTNNIHSENTSIRDELTATIEDIKTVRQNTYICQNDSGASAENNGNNIVASPCDLIRVAWDWGDFDTQFGVDADLQERVEKDLQIKFDRRSIEQSKDDNNKIVEDIEKPMWVTKIGARGKSYREIEANTRESALHTNAAYRNAVERGIALEFANDLYKVKQSDRAEDFWQTTGGVSIVFVKIFGWDFKDRVFQYFSPFFSSLIFAILLARAALTSADDRGKPKSFE